LTEDWYINSWPQYGREIIERVVTICNGYRKRTNVANKLWQICKESNFKLITNIFYIKIKIKKKYIYMYNLYKYYMEMSFVETFKNVAKYRSKNNFVESSK